MEIISTNKKKFKELTDGSPDLVEEDSEVIT